MPQPRNLDFYFRYCFRPRMTWLLVQLRFIFITGTLQTKDYFRTEKPSIVRAIVGTGSYLWALAAYWPQGSFERNAYQHLRTFMGLAQNYSFFAVMPRTAELVWATMFLMHAAGLSLIALYKPKTDTWPLIVNSYGLTLWLLSTLGINWSVHAIFTPGSSMEFTVCGFATWALYRTEFAHGRSQ